MNRIEINTYPEFWNIEMTISSIEGHQIPFSLTLKKIFYFAITFMLMALLMNVPGMHLIRKIKVIGNPAFLYLGLPGMATYYLNKQKIDGKQPYIYVIDMVVFLLSTKEFEYFRPISKGVKYNLSKLKVYFRVEEIVGAFELGKTVLDKKMYRMSYKYL